MKMASNKVLCADNCGHNSKIMSQIPSEKQFYIPFCAIYMCKNNHFTYVCKCCDRVSTSGIIDLHIYLQNNRVKMVNYYCVGINTKNNKSFIILDLIELFRYIPALCCFDLKYDEVFKDYFTDTSGIIIDDDYDGFQDIIKIVKQQQIYCPFCKAPFDSFPSIIMVVGHFAICSKKYY